MKDRTFLSQTLKPGRYLGHEFNITKKTFEDSDFRVALAFPDLYEIGMSHQGLQILYHLLNAEPAFYADRCYCPDKDAETLLRQRQIPLSGLQSGQPLGNFDVLGISLPYELCYTNILTILDLAQIPLRANERGEAQPIILGGGAISFNPEPVAAFFDAILLGDGEEAILEIASLLLRTKGEGLSRREKLDQLAAIEGVYVPGHFVTEYDQQGRTTAIRKVAGEKSLVTKRTLANLSRTDHLFQPLVPNAKIVHDRLGIEVARGCTRGCRFCQAGITYRPVRERSPAEIFRLAQEGLDNSGFEELALLSLSTGDYSCLNAVLPGLMQRFSSDFVSVSMPSMRVGTLTPAIMEEIKKVRKTGFTLAPEAGSERLRQVINKGITEQDLLDTCRQAYSLGWQMIKLYFMIGLPTETIEDVEAIRDLAGKVVSEQGRAGGRGRKQVNLSVGTFVPKPHTPFERCRQLSMDESWERLTQLRQSLPRKGCGFRYHDSRLSFLEGVFSRGDRRLSELIVRAWQMGARLDGWDEHFDLPRWQTAAAELGLDLEFYLRQREDDEVLPWSHLSTGVTASFLAEEMAKALQGSYTPDCRYHACQKCGLCDFKTIQPVVHNRKGELDEASLVPATEATSAARLCPADDASHFKYLVNYQRLGEISCLGHLEILQVIIRSLRRAGIEPHYTKGFNPTPKISFAPALPAGTESLAEFFIIDLPEPLTDLAESKRRLSAALPPGLDVTDIKLHSGKIPQSMQTTYLVELPAPLTTAQRRSLTMFLEADSCLVEKTRKGVSKQIDIRPMIVQLEVQGPSLLRMQAISTATKAGVKPAEALAHLLTLDEEQVNSLKIMKTEWFALEQDGQ